MQNIRILAKRRFRYFVLKVIPILNAYVQKRGISQSKNYEICSEVNQFIYTLVQTCLPNIRILAKGVLQIFCSQGYSYIKFLCSKQGNNSVKNLRKMLRSYSIHLHLSPNLPAKYKDPRLCSSLDMLFTSLFLYKMP